MPWAAGSYTKGNAGSGGWTGDASLGIGIEAGRHDTQDNDFATGINQCLNKDGSNAMTGALNVGGNKIVSLADGTASTDGVTFGQVTAGINTEGTVMRPTSTRYSANSSGPAYSFRKSRGASIGTNTIVQNGDELGLITFAGANGTGFDIAASIQAVVNGVPGASGDMPGALAFSTVPDGSTTLAERMRITNNGRVGIGTTAPDYLVHIAGSTGKTYIGDTIEALDTGANNNGAIYFGAAPSSTTNPTAGIEASWGSSNTVPQISIGVTRDGNKTRTIYDYNNTIRSFTANTERTRIDSSGYLLVGYTGSNGAYKLQVNSQIFATSSTIATSDANYKENVSTITNGLELVSSLRPVQFDWKQHPVHDFSDSTTVGFIAQEVQEALANTAYKDAIVKANEVALPDGTVEPFLGIAEGNMIALLVSAIKELKARVEALEA